MWCGAGDGFHGRGHLFLQKSDALWIAKNSSIFDLYVQIKGIQVVTSINDHTKVSAGFRELDQRGLDLAGENDQAPDRDGIIGTPLDGANFRMGATTGTALLPPDARKIAATI